MSILNGLPKESDDFLLSFTPVTGSGAGWDGRIDAGFALHANNLRMCERLLSLRKGVNPDNASGNGFALMLTPVGFITLITGVMIFNLDDAGDLQPSGGAATWNLKDGVVIKGTVNLNSNGIPSPGIAIMKFDATPVQSGPASFVGGTLLTLDPTANVFSQSADQIDMGLIGYTFPV